MGCWPRSHAAVQLDEVEEHHSQPGKEVARITGSIAAFRATRTEQARNQSTAGPRTASSNLRLGRVLLQPPGGSRL
jgi:hypothetical protein